MTQVALTDATGIPTRHISEMENGKHLIGKVMAKRLGEVLASGIKCSCKCGELPLT
ncbi:MAG: hypothetical protein ACP59X_07225 [Solidesulfovibrio sp. DCME]|uniref:hypothetical protein n=1 Tax=Solidesulfovibrio sp. DCME TaxID=3447380 RepID=UPI003D1354B6